MDRQALYKLMAEPEEFDYGRYLDVKHLLGCQKPFDQLCNADELQFQIVHQVEELWMKLLAYTLVEVDEQMRLAQSFKVLGLLGRCHAVLRLMTEQLVLLETMSPKDYQQIRLQLGNGSGQESPGFRILLKQIPELWPVYVDTYLQAGARSIDEVYDTDYAHDAAYAVAEAMMELDEQFQKFRWHHILLIHRSIGMGAASLKGRSVDLLQVGAKQRFFPELWDIRARMTDRWGASYGVRRQSLEKQDQD